MARKRIVLTFDDEKAFLDFVMDQRRQRLEKLPMMVDANAGARRARRCGRCGGLGHNVRGCKVRPESSSGG